MGLFDKEQKADRYVERLENEIEYLRNQVSKLQECLYAQSSPKAYEQMKLDEQYASNQEVPETKKKELEWERNLYSKLAEEQERPLFETIEELEAVLARGTRGKLMPAAAEPGNPES